MKLHFQIFLALFSLFLSSQAICVPRNITYPPLSPKPLPSILEDPSGEESPEPPDSPEPSPAPLEPPDSPEPSPAPLEPPSPGAGGVRVADICKQTEHAELCEETVGPRLGPGEEATPATALVKEIEALAEESDEAVKATKEGRARDPKNAKCYKVCYEMFIDCREELHTAAEAMAANDMDTAETRLSGALAYFETCDDTFAEAGQDSPLAPTTARLKKLASNCLAIAAIS